MEHKKVGDNLKKPCIFRRRYIPDEIVDITSDELVYRDDNLLVTRWKAIKPRKDISGGMSWAFLKDGIKVSKFFDAEGNFLYWYCDIIDVDYVEKTDTYTFCDLLVDVRIRNGKVEVLDIDELVEASQKGLITNDQLIRSLSRVDVLLKNIYDDKFPPKECTEIF